MREPRNYQVSLIVAAAMASSVVSSGCVVERVRLYDADQQDYHRWDDREDRAYRRYLSEQHREYREMSQQNAEDQRNYWRWRHAHEDGGD